MELHVNGMQIIKYAIKSLIVVSLQQKIHADIICQIYKVFN